MDSVANPGCQTEQLASLACVVDAEMSTLYHQLDPQGTTIQWVRRTEHVAPNQKQLASGFEITPNANHLNIAADTAVELVNSSMSSENVEQQNELQQPELQQPNGDAMEPSSSRESVKLIYENEPRVSKLESNMEEKEHEALETDKNVNDDTQTTVRTRVNETKEISHKVFRTFVSDSKDSMSFVMPEYSELPYLRGKVVSNGQEDLTRVFSTDFIDHSPRSSREETKTRSVDRHERRYIPVTRISSSKPELKSKDSDTVPIEEYENMKRQCELEIAYWKRMCNEIHNGGDQLLANEPLRRHIVNLEAELRDSKCVSETVSIELQTLRREYESLVQKTAELESAKRNADLRYRDCKSSNKRLQTELQEKNTLIEKLRETYSKDKRTQYLFDEMKAEHTRLARDYEILRQTYNQKEQQVQSMLMEQAEMQRKLDACECERRQLEHRLYSQPVSSRVVKQTDTHAKADACQREEETEALHSETSKTLYSSPQTAPSPPGWRYEVDESMVRTKEFDSTTETIGLGNNDTTENVDGRLEGVTERLQDEKTSTLQQLKESPNVTRITVRPRRPDPMPDLPRRSSSKTQKRTSGMESFGGSMTDSVRQDDERQHYYHSSRYETNFVRKVGDSYSPRPTRPSTAYGHFASVADRDTYRSPLPPRSTTSFGRFHTMDYAFRSPERRSPSRKPRFYFSYAPEAFRHEVIRPSRMELLSLEDQLARLKREKRRLGKQLSRYSSRVYPQPEDIYNGLLRLDQEIRVLEAKLNSLRGTR